jgi:hypothetical protein
MGLSHSLSCPVCANRRGLWLHTLGASAARASQYRSKGRPLLPTHCGGQEGGGRV